MISWIHLKNELSVKKVSIADSELLTIWFDLVSNEKDSLFFLPTISENLRPSSKEVWPAIHSLTNYGLFQAGSLISPGGWGWVGGWGL